MRNRGNWHKKSGSNLLLAAAILSGGGGSGSADGQETETGDIRSAAQSPSQTDAHSQNPIAGLLGVSAASSPVSPDIGKRIKSPREEEDKAIPSPSADGVTAAASGVVSKSIPVLSADVEAMLGQLGGRSLGESGLAMVFRALVSKTDPVLHVRFPAPWYGVAEVRRI